jgi:hypothetical protein
MAGNGGSRVTAMNSSTALVVRILGAVVGSSGAIHGVYSALMGNTPTGGMLLPAVGAFTVVQNYLITGILAICLGVAVIVWTIGFIGRRHGPAVYVLLSASLFLVGGGIAEVAVIIVAGLLSTRIRNPLDRWHRLAGRPVGRALSKLWPYALAIASTFFLVGYAIWLFVLSPGEVREVGPLHYVRWASLGAGFIMLLLVIPCGFMRDVHRRAVTGLRR